MIKETPRKTSVSCALVFKWYKRFEECGDSIQERVGRGRKPKVTERTLTLICDALEGDRRLTVRSLSEMFDLSYGTVYAVLTKQLQMSKVFFIS